MAILVNENTKVICQGLTGSQGMVYPEQAIDLKGSAQKIMKAVKG